jgi:hypothetical protein
VSSDNEDNSSSGPPLAVETAGGGGGECENGFGRAGMSAEVVAMLLPHVPLVSRLLGQQVNRGSNSNLLSRFVFWLHSNGLVACFSATQLGMQQMPPAMDVAAALCAGFHAAAAQEHDTAGAAELWAAAVRPDNAVTIFQLKQLCFVLFEYVLSLSCC